MDSLVFVELTTRTGDVPRKIWVNTREIVAVEEGPDGWSRLHVTAPAVAQAGQVASTYPIFVEGSPRDILEIISSAYRPSAMM